VTETSPTAQRREVGTLLRAHRERAGLKVAEVAERVGMSSAKLSRLERGLRGLQIADVRTLCGVYGLSESETRELISSTRASREPGWWASYSDLDSNAPLFYGLEVAASAVLGYHAGCVPGLLQTADYATALLSQVRPHREFTTQSVAERVEARMRRKQAVSGGPGKLLHFVVDEAPLRRRVGSAGIMADQLHALSTAMRDPRTRIQVLPFDRGAHPGVDGSFSIQSFSESSQRDAVFVEGLAGTLLIENESQVVLYKQAFEALSALALDEKYSRRMLRTIGADWRDTALREQ